MREGALDIIKKKIDDITVNEAPHDPRSPADHVAFQAAKREQEQLYAFASLSTSLIFGMLAEVVMLRQAVQKTSAALEHIRDEMQMSRDLRVDDHG